MKLVRKAGVIPMMAIFLSDRILLVVDEFTRVSAFQRAIPHGDLASVAALEVRAGPPDAFRRWLRALLDPRRVSSSTCRFHATWIGLSGIRGHLSSSFRSHPLAPLPPNLGTPSRLRVLGMVRRRRALLVPRNPSLAGRRARSPWALQYGLPRSTSAPQKKKSAVLGSPTGQRQSWLANSRSERRCASEMSASL